MERTPITSRWTLAAVMTLAVVASTVATVVADSFSDVPDGSFFEAAIVDITDAGCASGFGDGTFRPTQPATRGQFALWSANCLPRTAWDETPNIGEINDTWREVSGANIDVAGVEGHTQHIVATATVGVDGSAGECACRVALQVRVVDASDPSAVELSDSVSFSVIPVGGYPADSGSATFRFSVPTDNQYRVTTEVRILQGTPDLYVDAAELLVSTSPLNNALDGVD